RATQPPLPPRPPLHDALPIWNSAQIGETMIPERLRIAKDFVFRRIGLQKRGFGQRIAIPDEWITTRLPGENTEYSSRTLVTFVQDRKSTRLNSSHVSISYAVF